MENANICPIYIVGPTATGKSDLGVKIAEKIGGVIISADSMQIYRGLDIGTAKVSEEMRRRVPHKMIDILEPDAEFSVAEYYALASKEIDAAIKEGKYPIIVGGTGLYVEALIHPMNFSGTNKNDVLRKYLSDLVALNGEEALHKTLAYFDPDSAKRLDQNDVKRVIRALEIVLTSGRPMSESAQKSSADEHKICMVGLNCERKELYERINKRVDDMFRQGLAREALSQGDFDRQSMQAIGYKEFKQLKFRLVNGELVPDEASLEEVKALIKQHTRNYAKRQITWFKRYETIRWFDVADAAAALEYAIEFAYCQK